MAVPTLTDFFGADTTIDATNAANPVLKIPYSSLVPAGLSDIDNFDNPEVLFASITKLVSLWTRNDTSEDNAIEMRQPTVSAQTRANKLRLVYSYTADIYGSEITATDLDPDNVILN